ncbi:restriction endonuclease subunit S [Faecalibacterium prausnitzii]|uniref:Type-1 restriction enzyme EcoKI specificity protein n=1 Tax=Faecalibacterium prausnitzii TaxID=853 RepID=A0A564U5S2_9FIRM|nr:restriction endonuclease subunit S [Faecalibacterium prausnitzii]VUX14810.1 Type-1 restriction enzyme EcoKI specificity protein [Faecalibacterium prausnitzii]
MARKMKDSGIEWIGEIPEGWEIRKIKNNFMIYAGATPKSEKAEYWDGGIPWITPADFKTTDKYVSYGRKSLTALGYDSCGSTLVPAGSIIFSKRAPVGSVVIAKNTLCTNQGCLACIPNDAVNSTYFYYCMSIFTEQFELVSAGTTFKEIAASTFASFLLPCPPLSQQNEIVNFLDKESSRIDSMLSKTRSSIEEYKKLKQAVITQAVTKGVRGEREMKDSGVEWIGEIPKKWNRCKLNSICTFINGDRSKNYPSSEDFQDIGIPFIGADSLNGFFVDTYSARHISPAKYASMGGLKITQGDILYTLRGSTIGKNAIANFNDGTIASSLVGIRVKSPFLASSSFLFYWLNSLNEFVQRDLCINGSTAPNLSAENVAQFFIYIPDITEQHEIADYLDAKCAEIDRLIAKKEQLVKELESYKKSLIYEVVTGKREV